MKNELIAANQQQAFGIVVLLVVLVISPLIIFLVWCLPQPPLSWSSLTLFSFIFLVLMLLHLSPDILSCPHPSSIFLVCPPPDPDPSLSVEFLHR